MRFEPWPRRCAVRSFFALAFGISWGGILVVMGATDFDLLVKWSPLAVGLIAGGFEEMGWTGFAAPRLLDRQRLFLAGSSLGRAWAPWHVLVDFRRNFRAVGIFWLLEFAVFHVAALTAYRLLMTWVYAYTHSLLLAILMHASCTGWLLVPYPGTSLEQGLVRRTGFAVALWVVVGLVMAGCMGRRSRPSPQLAPTGEAFSEPRQDHLRPDMARGATWRLRSKAYRRLDRR